MNAKSELQADISPERIFGAFHAFQLTAAMRAAVDLEIFTAIAEGNDTPVKLAQRCGAAERGVRILCDFLVIHGFLTKDGSHYGLTPESAAFLSKQSPAYLGTISKFLASPDAVTSSADFTECVRAGGQKEDSPANVADDAIWVEFARSMAPLVRSQAEPLAAIVSARGKVSKVLDVAAGHGLFGIAMAKQNPAAEIYASDLVNVLQVAEENAAKAGVASRHHLLPGSAFEIEFGSGYDVALLTNFLHHFDSPTNVELLKKVRAAMVPGGTAAALEFIPDEDRVSPPAAASFSLTMLSATPAGDAYTFAELKQMFNEAGFSEIEMQPVPPNFQRVVIAKS